MTDFQPDRPPKRYTAKQFNEWRARWCGIDPDDALKTNPFGYTDAGLLDYRGLTVRKPGPGMFKQFHHATFRGCDFTAASFAETNCTQSTFQGCIFDYTDLNNFGDYGCNFTNCRFYRGEWRAGAIGFDADSKAPGKHRSSYINCHFENIKLNKTSIRSPLFVNCSFAFKKLSSIDFGYSHFLCCRFIGAFQDLTFRGANDLERRIRNGGEANVTGFTDVSFENAALQWLDIRGGFPLRSVTMPKDGSAFTADLPHLCRDRATLLGGMTDPNLHSLASRYLDITCRFADEQPIDIISRFDLIESATRGGEGDETLADTLYTILKSTYAKPA